jgi:hypothetical protein
MPFEDLEMKEGIAIVIASRGHNHDLEVMGAVMETGNLPVAGGGAV